MSKPKKATKPKKEPKKVIEANAFISVPRMSETIAEVKTEEVKKPVKKKTELKVEKPLYTLPDPPEYKPKKPDNGWRTYWIWATHELAWDDKADEKAILASIKSHITKAKKALVEALNSFSDKELVVKTDLKKDPYPYESHIEVWIETRFEDDVRKRLIEIPDCMIIDPDIVAEPIQAKIERAK
jgi:hypothetical protein